MFITKAGDFGDVKKYFRSLLPGEYTLVSTPDGQVFRIAKGELGETSLELAARNGDGVARTKSMGADGLGNSPRNITANDLTDDLLNTKPKNSPNPQKWLNKNGQISIDKNGTWKYTNSNGQSVKYPNGYPDFKEAGGVKQEIDIGKFSDYATDFKKADLLAPNGPRDPVKNTWHHSQDGHTLQEVNKSIHKQFTHRGGMFLKKK